MRFVRTDFNPPNVYHPYVCYRALDLHGAEECHVYVYADKVEVYVDINAMSKEDVYDFCNVLAQAQLQQVCVEHGKPLLPIETEHKCVLREGE